MKSRRELMAALGSAAAALPALQMFATRANAATSKRAKYVLFWYSPNGVHHPSFWPTGGETDFTLSSILEPLAKYRSKLLIPGPELVNGQPKANTGLCHAVKPPQHQAQVCLTGDPVTAPYKPQVGEGEVKTAGPSLDQVISQALPVKPKFPSLEFGIHPVGGDTPSVINFSPQGTPLRRMRAADEAWARVFEGSMGDPNGAQERLTRDRRVAVSNFLKARFAGLNKQVGREDQAVLDGHLQALRETEQRIFNSPAAQVGCRAPGQPMVPTDPATVRARADTPELGAAFLDIIVHAFACNLTRVASITWGYPGGGGTGGLRAPWLGIKDSHHALSHHGGTAGLLDGYNRLTRWLASQIAETLARLERFPDPDGGTLLDHTVIYWFNRHGDGNAHTNDALPAVIAGGAGGAIRTGRFLSLPRTNNNELLLGVAHAMGVPLTSFGHGAMRADRPLTGMLA